MYNFAVILAEGVKESKLTLEQHILKVQLPKKKLETIIDGFKKYLRTLEGSTDITWEQSTSELKRLKTAYSVPNNDDTKPKNVNGNICTEDVNLMQCNEFKNAVKEPSSNTALSENEKSLVTCANNVKKERESDESNLDVNDGICDIKQEENNSEMPPPSLLSVAKKRKKIVPKAESARRPRTRRAQKLADSNKENPEFEFSTQTLCTRDSDVIVENTKISVIELIDSDQEVSKIFENTVTENATINDVDENYKRSLSCDDVCSIERTNDKIIKKTKCHASHSKETKSRSVQETANYIINETNCVLEKSQVHTSSILNQTIIISKNDDVNKVGNEKKQNEQTPMTDNRNNNPIILLKKCDKTSNRIFSPYDQSPVKMKVQAFEKLGGHMESPNSSTRTRAQAKNELNNQYNTTRIPSLSKHCSVSSNHSILPSSVKKNNKIGTPLHPNSAFKTPNTLRNPQSGLKENRYKQKEFEAVRKKEALLQASIEDKKRKREEKQLKAQKTREILEKDKQKCLENAERMKLEKTKQVLTEKEEKMLKQKEEHEKKRNLAKQRAVEEKRREEQKKLTDQTNNKKLPKYLTMKEPLLPTTDCFDSDDDNNENNQNYLPDWAKKNSLYKKVMVMITSGWFKNTYFCRAPKTIDLTQVFPSIEPRRLKRTSSAVWTKPPRYTFRMSPVNE